MRRLFAIFASSLLCVCIYAQNSDVYLNVQRFIEAGQFDAALSLLDQNVHIIESDSTNISNASCYMYYSLIYTAKKDYERAIPVLQKLVTIFEKNKQDILSLKNENLLQYYYALSCAYKEVGDSRYQSALEATKRLYEDAKMTNTDTYENILLDLISNGDNFLYGELHDFYIHREDFCSAAICSRLMGEMMSEFKTVEALDDAEKYYLQSKSEFQKDANCLNINENAKEYSILLNKITLLLIERNKYAASLNYAEEHSTITQTLYGEASVEHATSLYNKAVIYFNLGNIDESIRIAKESVALYKRTDCSECYNRAIKLLEDIKIIKNEDSPVSHKYKRQGKDGEIERAIILSTKGKYNDALRLLQKVCRNYNEELQNDSNGTYSYSYVQNLLGRLYLLKGDFNNAEESLLNAQRSTIKYVKEKRLYRDILTNLGWLNYNLRQYDQAFNFLNEAKLRYEQAADTSFDYAGCLVKQALVLIEQNQRLWAKLYAEVARDKILNMTGVRSESIADVLVSIAYIYRELGYYNDAVNLCQQVKNISEKANYKEGTHNALNCIGSVYLKLHEYDLAIDAFKEAISTKNTVDSQINLLLSYNYIDNVNNEDIKSVALSIALDMQKDITHAFSYMSAEQREQYWQQYSSYINLLNGVLTQNKLDESASVLYNNALFSKGLLLRVSSSLTDAVLQSNDSASIALYNELTDLQAQSGNKHLEDSERQRIEEIDKFLTKKFLKVTDLEGRVCTNWKEVQKKMATNDVAIEFIESPSVNDDMSTSDKTLYALVLRKKDKNPNLVKLCNESELKELTERRFKLDKHINQLYSCGNPRMYKGERMYHAIWEPLEPFLKENDNIYYSPIGILHSISFQAISHDSIFISDKYNIHLVSSTSAIHAARIKKNMLKDAVIYGGIQYDVDSISLINASAMYNNNNVGSLWRQEDALATRSGWNFLNGTVKESADIRDILEKNKYKVNFYTGIEANEESFKSIDGAQHDIIHIATHGFFLSDNREIQENKFLLAHNFHDNPNPLLKSGLLFSGANRTWLSSNIIEGIEDGILSAQEISDINLSGVSTVVLSACETGLGEVQSSEGVFGLQRAFKLAGVQTIIMSLWKVPDGVTSEIMIDFYKRWMNGEEIHKAFIEAKRSIKQKYPQPYNWAGFVMLD